MKIFDSFAPRYLVPNGVTCVSMVLGFASIRLSLLFGDAASLVNAAWFVMYAVLLDKVDGFLARRLNATSLIGVQLDSFADFVTFGLAPAALFSRALPALAPEAFGGAVGARVMLVVVAAYALAASIRLAKFNVTTSGDDPRFFRGLPSTSSGGLLASALLAHRELSLGSSAAIGLFAFMIVNAALMLSNLPQPKIRPTKVAWQKALQLFVLGSAYVLIPLRLFPVYLVVVATSVSIAGFVYGIAIKRREERDDGGPEPAPSRGAPLVDSHDAETPAA